MDLLWKWSRNETQIGTFLFNKNYRLILFFSAISATRILKLIEPGGNPQLISHSNSPYQTISYNSSPSPNLFSSQISLIEHSPSSYQNTSIDSQHRYNLNLSAAANSTASSIMIPPLLRKPLSEADKTRTSDYFSGGNESLNLMDSSSGYCGATDEFENLDGLMMFECREGGAEVCIIISFHYSKLEFYLKKNHFYV